jgi:Flp pilus assembly pilin Flp
MTRPGLPLLARHFWQDRSGASAAEFALVLPLLILFLLGTIDAGRLMWTWNRAEKATQMGVRLAVVEDPVADGLRTYSYAVDGGLPQGDPVPQSDFGAITCNSASCTCTVSPCPFGTARNADAFTEIVNRMHDIMAEIAGPNVVIDYAYSGLGFAGDPNGPDVAPLVTVSLTGVQFTPIFLFGAVTLNLPAFSATLTMEGGGSTTT